MAERTALRAPEVAVRLGVDVETVYRWLASGELPGTKIGRTWFTRLDELEQRLASQRDEEAPHVRGGQRVPETGSVEPSRDRVDRAAEHRSAGPAPVRPAIGLSPLSAALSPPIVGAMTTTAQRALWGRVGAAIARSRHDPRELTAAARRAFLGKFEAQVRAERPDLSEPEILRRAGELRTAHFLRLAARSSAVRAQRKAAAGLAARVPRSDDAA